MAEFPYDALPLAAFIFFGFALAYAVFCMCFPENGAPFDAVRVRIAALLILPIFWLGGLQGLIFPDDVLEHTIVSSLYISLSTLAMCYTTLTLRIAFKRRQHAPINP
jgi:hypothetical protein